MKENIPPLKTIQGQLMAFDYAELQGLADKSSVPFTTLLKIRNGVTKNPGIETVRLFWPNLAASPANAGECAICSVAQA